MARTPLLPPLLGVTALLSGAAGLTSWARRRRPLPAPSGPHPVGTRSTTATGGPRTLPVQVWYPAAQAGPGSPLLPHGRAATEVLAAAYGLPAVVFAPVRLLHGHATEGLPPLAGAHPLVLLVHGWRGFRAIHADLAEALASRGHVVVAADHVGGALVAQHDDGRVEALDATLLPPEGTPGYWTRADALVARYTEDLEAVLDAVPGLLARLGIGVADAARTVVVGHSTGGGAGVRLASRDRRVAGIVGMDPWVRPVPAAERRLDVPLVAVRSSQWVGNHNDRILSAMPGVDLRSVPGSVHTDFTMLGFLSPALRLTGLTSADPRTVHDVVMGAVTDLQATLRVDAA